MRRLVAPARVVANRQEVLSANYTHITRLLSSAK